MYGYVYITTNNVNGKQYIGQHKSSYIDETYKGSGKILVQAFKKEGKQNFSCEILKQCESKAELDYWEHQYIEDYNCVQSPLFYNLKPGGSGGGRDGLIFIHKGDEIKRVTQSELDAYINDGYELGQGRKQCPEEIHRRANSHVGLKYTHSDEFIKHGSKLKGKKLSSEHKEHVRQGKLGIPCNRKGKIGMTDELHNIYVTPDEVNTYLSMGYRLGSKHHKEGSSYNHTRGKFGTVCINKSGVTKYVLPDVVQDYLSNGWTVGRSTPSMPKSDKRKWMNNGIVQTPVKECDFEKYLLEGYKFGMIKVKTP